MRSKTDLDGDLDHWSTGLHQEVLRPLQTHPCVNNSRRTLCLLHEEALELPSGQSNQGSHLGNGDRILDMVLHDDERRLEPRILAFNEGRAVRLDVGRRARPLDLQHFEGVSLCLSTDMTSND